MDAEQRQRQREYQARYYRANREKVAAANRSWKERNPEALREQQRRYYERTRADGRYWDGHIRRRYGITAEEADAIWERQGGRCAICGIPIAAPGQKGTHLDHDHGTKVVRGFLCLACNQGLGRFKDDPILLRRAARYLG